MICSRSSPGNRRVASRRRKTAGAAVSGGVRTRWPRSRPRRRGRENLVCSYVPDLGSIAGITRWTIRSACRRAATPLANSTIRRLLQGPCAGRGRRAGGLRSDLTFTLMRSFGQCIGRVRLHQHHGLLLDGRLCRKPGGIVACGPDAEHDTSSSGTTFIRPPPGIFSLRRALRPWACPCPSPRPGRCCSSALADWVLRAIVRGLARRREAIGLNLEGRLGAAFFSTASTIFTKNRIHAIVFFMTNPAFSGQIPSGLFGGRVAGAGPPVERRQPEPTASIVGRGSRRNGPRDGREDRRHGPPDASRLGSPLNASGLEGLLDNWTKGPKPRLSAQQVAEFTQIVEAGPEREKDGVVRWRRVDLKRVIAERFGVDFHERYVGTLLKKIGFSHISARPRHPAQDERIVEAFQKTSHAR